MKKIIMFIFLLGLSLGVMTTSIVNIGLKKEVQVEKESIEDRYSEKEEIEEEQHNDKIQINEKEEYVNITVKSGYTSHRVIDILYENELIYNKEDFKLMLDLLNLNSKIKVGEINIKKGSSMKSIIDKLTN
ncbi:endolytic transglycosylase MltG [Alkalithermobacter paradoxus]|uniref:YceG-like family protein n=1 Tax=Alkalithermobacter paradoxus TaxID=29349 RepID=A0A1V4IAU7_9FIRM|nr:YceG-like family protein [[Clostridium] thermoalcaliphilum]